MIVPCVWNGGIALWDNASLMTRSPNNVTMGTNCSTLELIQCVFIRSLQYLFKVSYSKYLHSSTVLPFLCLLVMGMSLVAPSYSGHSNEMQSHLSIKHYTHLSICSLLHLRGYNWFEHDWLTAHRQMNVVDWGKKRVWNKVVNQRVTFPPWGESWGIFQWEVVVLRDDSHWSWSWRLSPNIVWRLQWQKQCCNSIIVNTE